MKIGYIANGEDVGGVEYHRLLKPFSQFEDVTRCVGADRSILDHDFDVVVFNRVLPVKNQRGLIKDLRDKGTYVICDIDDYWVLYPNHALTVDWRMSRMRSRVIEALTLADEVWTTHELLGSYIDRLNANWYVIPNAIDSTEEQWQPKKEYGNRVGWCGGLTHFHDLQRVKFNKKPVLGGIEPIGIDADYVKGTDVFNYARIYDMFDVAIAPLVDNRFNRCKSNLKILESGMKGLPIFVENIHPYTDDARGVYKVDDWQVSIREAESMEAERIKEEGQALRSYVLENYELRKVNRLRVERLVG